MQIKQDLALKINQVERYLGLPLSDLHTLLDLGLPGLIAKYRDLERRAHSEG